MDLSPYAEDGSGSRGDAVRTKIERWNSSGPQDVPALAIQYSEFRPSLLPLLRRLPGPLLQPALFSLDAKRPPKPLRFHPDPRSPQPPEPRPQRSRQRQSPRAPLRIPVRFWSASETLSLPASA